MNHDADLQLLRKVCRRGAPPVPSTGARLVFELLADESSSTERLIEQLEADAALQFGLLSLANLPMFSTNRPAKTVRQAVLQLGRPRSASLLWVLALSHVMQNHADLHPRVRDKLWRHSVLTGVLTQQLLKAAGFDDVGDGFAAGMAHDVGHLLMANPAPQLGIVWHEEHDAWVERQPSLAPERDHCRLGSSLMDFWNAPEELAAATLWHHDPGSAPATQAPLVVGVRLADLVAEYVDLERPARQIQLDAAPAWQQLQTVAPWNAVADFQRLTIECLPEAILATEHLTNLLGA